MAPPGPNQRMGLKKRDQISRDHLQNLTHTTLQGRIWHLDGAMDNPEVHQNEHYAPNWPKGRVDTMQSRDHQPFPQPALPLESAIGYRQPDQGDSCDYTSRQVNSEADAEDAHSDSS